MHPHSIATTRIQLPSLFLLLLTSAPHNALAISNPLITPRQQDQPPTVTITTPPTVPSTAPSFVSNETFTLAILNSTNLFRAEHGAPALAYNATLAQFATDYLNSMNNNDDSGCVFAHSGGPYGENLALGCSDVQSCVDAWGGERTGYDFDDPGFNEETGHFTQLVWKNTTDVGCGRRLCGGEVLSGMGGWFLVCEYWPRGMFWGSLGSRLGGRLMGRRG
ncbi:CAP domain-containing protein [Bombardia bombarda]|uniref:CAP domain-containing protein n=1 Tax=Bombardia bombarda TaxID=252184 RepID=A0AA39WHW4_9PEZI|nr:CAP domain-containing protein [Bombardia bombarda]